jgi:choline dehydrogenase-like flavoprotein
MDVSYLPKAFARGALLFTETKATRVMIENGRAVGIIAHSVEKKRVIKIRAQAVVLAGGAVPTPLLLLGQRLCNQSGQVGRNLSLHPGAAATAQFGETLEVYKYIPQGVGCDQFHRDGILLLGANPALNISANFFPFYGRRLTEAMDALDRVGSMGVLVRDATQNGRVRLGINGEPLITYWLQRADLEQMHRGILRILELFWAAGARRLYPLGHRMPVIENAAQLERFRKWHTAPSDFIWTAFHPLGTVRMGRDPRTSVVDFDHQTHEVRNLFIVDGSTVPGPTAVNPQLTIMAMADRAAGRIGERLE